MPLFGAHMSIAGGMHKALLAAKEAGMDTVQIFTASPNQWQIKAIPAAEEDVQSGKLLTKSANQWAAKPLDAEAVRLFRATLRETRLRFPTAHDSYLINLASPD